MSQPTCFRSSRRPSVMALVTIVLLAIAVRSGPTAIASDFTITQTMLANKGDYLDFAAASIDGVPVNLQPGDTIYIEGHTRQQLILSRITQGTAQNPITITNTGGQFVISSTSSSAPQGFAFRGCRHIVIRGTASPGNYDYGIKIAQVPSSGVVVTQHTSTGGVVTGSSNWELRDVEIGNTGFAGVFSKNDSLSAGSGFVMENVKIHHNYIHDTGGEGMYIGASDFHTVDRHEIHGLEIHDNLVVNAGWDGIQVGCATQNASIHHNTIVGFGTGAPDIYQDEGIRSNPGTAADIYANVIVGSPTSSGTGIFANPYNSVTYYNNVIVTPQEAGIYLAETSQAKGYVNGYTVRLLNNTIVSPGHYGINFASGSHSSANLEYNNLVAAPATAGQYVTVTSGIPITQGGGVHVATVAAAGFVDSANSNFRLTASSPAVDAGVSTAAYGVTTDCDGTARPQGSAYDSGAYEFEPPIIGVITPVAYGQAGSGYCPATGAFNEQPTWDATDGVPTGVSSSPYASTQTAYANRHWYIDFGADWADVRITGTWTRYMPFTTASYSGFGAMWWDDDNDATNDNGVAATGLNFGTAQNLNTGSSQPWVQDTDHTSAPVAPQRRYLIINTGSAPATRANEFAISGYVVD